MEHQKPEIIGRNKLCEELLSYLQAAERSATREELSMLLFGAYNSSNDRKTREVVSVLAKRYPIISLSHGKGYKLAKTKDDLDEVVHQWKEFDSRQNEIEKRKIPLIRFTERVETISHKETK